MMMFLFGLVDSGSGQDGTFRDAVWTVKGRVATIEKEKIRYDPPADLGLTATAILDNPPNVGNTEFRVTWKITNGEETASLVWTPTLESPEIRKKEGKTTVFKATKEYVGTATIERKLGGEWVQIRLLSVTFVPSKKEEDTNLDYSSAR